MSKENKNLEEFVETVNKQVSKLTPEIIKEIGEDYILQIAVENPEKPGVYGFLLRPDYFKSPEHMEDIMNALLDRLDSIKNIHEKYILRNN
jgi:hypothetical protein